MAQPRAQARSPLGAHALRGHVAPRRCEGCGSRRCGWERTDLRQLSSATRGSACCAAATLPPIGRLGPRSPPTPGPCPRPPAPPARTNVGASRRRKISAREPPESRETTCGAFSCPPSSTSSCTYVGSYRMSEWPKPPRPIPRWNRLNEGCTVSARNLRRRSRLEPGEPKSSARIGRVGDWPESEIDSIACIRIVEPEPVTLLPVRIPQ